MTRFLRFPPFFVPPIPAIQKSRFDRATAGFTLLELLVVISIVGLLIALVLPISSKFLARAKKAKCISQMKAIHGGLSGYVTDVGHWPQMEEDKADFSEDEFFKFWVVATEPYGLDKEVWLCPSDAGYHSLSKEQLGEFIGSYVPTRFGKKPQQPFQYNQPWLLERGNFHARGCHILMPDGSVTDSQDPFGGR